MSRKLLTQKFPCLIPFRLWQRRLFKKIKDRLKRYKFSTTYIQEELQFRIYKHKSLLIRKLGDTDIQLQYNKVTNLNIAAARINKVVIKPGETFSFWKLVGTTSEKNGYKEGVLLLNGEAKKGIGGGLCQLGNLLYWMFLHTDMETKERYRHSYDPFPDYGRVIPFGTGATLMGGIIDLKLKNNSNRTYQIIVYLDDQYLRGEIRTSENPSYRYNIYEKNHRFVRKEDNQFYRQNEIYKKTINRETGMIVRNEMIMKNDCLVKYEVSEEKLEPLSSNG